MSKINQFIDEAEREASTDPYYAIMLTAKTWEALKAKYATKPAKRIPAKRAKPRKNRETPAEHEAVILKLFERANGCCEGARIRRDGELVREHAPDCPYVVPFHRGDPTHDKSRGSGGEWSLENLRWTSRQCHRWEHNGGKVIPSKKAATLER